jgi:Gas vesicle protein G
MLFIDDLLLFPITGFKFILRTLEKAAEQEYTDDAPLKERLLELQLQLENGEMTEGEYVAVEREILDQLREVQARRRELAGLPPEEEGPMSYTPESGSG